MLSKALPLGEFVPEADSVLQSPDMRWILVARKGRLGVELDPVSQKEKLISAAGGLVAILCVIAITQSLLGLTEPEW